MDGTLDPMEGDADCSSVGVLTEGALSPEQETVSRWLSSAVAVDVLPLREIETGAVDLASYPVLWWHRDALPDAGTNARLESVADRIDEYLKSGGGLFLSHGALAGVQPLGIDRNSPDRLEASVRPDGTHGFLVTRLYADHPLFETVDSLRVPTTAAETPLVCYEDLTPRDGDVVASRVDGETDRPSQNSLLLWDRGEGTVVGVGHGLSFDEAGLDAARRVVRNVLSHLADEASSPPYVGRPKDADAFAAMRETVPDSQHRPAYHFTPPANWLNDPNGVVQWDGTYHLFYQYNPAGPYHGSVHWGHAGSEDLVTWEDHPIALTPDRDAPDRDGCWSGCFVDDDGTPTFVYTGGRGREQLPCLATSDDDELETWTKHPENPIIDAVPAEPAVFSGAAWDAEFRDHNVWRDEETDTWYQLIGSGVPDVGGSALLYRSEDLREWEYRGPLLVGDFYTTGPVWECPELLQFEDASLLHVSDYDSVKYFLGKFDPQTEQFHVREQQHLDRGAFYAPQSLEDDDGRTVMFGWLRENRPVSDQWDAGWSGAMSLPRVVSVSDGDLSVAPATEVERLRGAHHRVTDVTIVPGESDFLPGIEGDALEIVAEFDAARAHEFGIALRQSPDRREETMVRYRPARRRLVVDRANASLNPNVDDDPHEMPVKLTEDGRLRLRLFLDRSVLEIFARDAQCLSSRVYPALESSVGVDLFATEEPVRLRSMDVWEMDSIRE